MADSVKKVLFVNSEMVPYLPESPVGNLCRQLPQGIQERKKEIRAFMPKYGCINERKNQLHEVIRLSGMNIIISDVDRPLVIKVASISSARIQVYFIDNEDYFRRKEIFRDSEGRFFADNGERAIFYARGVLETVKKKAYKDDPVFSGAKVVLSLYDDTPAETFADGLAETILFGGIKLKDVPLPEKAGGMELAQLAAQYSDGIILGSAGVDPALQAYVRELGKPLLPFDAAALADGSYMDQYNAFYDSLSK